MYNHSTFFLVGQVKFESALLIQVLITFLLGCLTSYVAAQRNRNRTLWFVCGLVFGWLALLFALFLPVKEEEGARPIAQVSEPEIKTDENVPTLPQKEWYYLDAAHKQTGPVPRATLQELWSQKVLSEASFVWQEGMSAWARIRDLPELMNQLHPENAA